MEEGQGTAETDDDAITSVMPPQINVPSKFLDSAFNAEKPTKSCREKSKQQTSDMQCNNSRQSSTSICRDTSQKSTSANSLNSSQQETSSACLDTCKNSGSETNCLNTSQQSTSSANCQLNASVTSQASESSTAASEYRHVLIIHCMGVYLHTVRQDIFKSGEGALSDIVVSVPPPALITLVNVEFIAVTKILLLPLIIFRGEGGISEIEPEWGVGACTKGSLIYAGDYGNN